MKLCVLVTTMNQTDLSLYNKMNLKTDVIIANQCEKNEIVEAVIDGHKVKMVSTDSRGLSKNRNIAYEHRFDDADLYMFSDDDLVYDNEYDRLILYVFDSHPESDAIKFNLKDLSDTRKIAMKSIKKFERATVVNMSSSGVCGVVFKRELLNKLNLRFDEMFGAGTENYCGEDSIFLRQLFKRRIHFYRSPLMIAGIDQSISTWYKGVDEKNLIVRGMVFAKNYPVMCYALSLISAYRQYRRKTSDLSFAKMIKCYHEGIRRIKKGDY